MNRKDVLCESIPCACFLYLVISLYQLNWFLEVDTEEDVLGGLCCTHL